MKTDLLCYTHEERVELLGVLAKCSAEESAFEKCQKVLSHQEESLRWRSFWFGGVVGVILGALTVGVVHHYQ